MRKYVLLVLLVVLVGCGPVENEEIFYGNVLFKVDIPSDYENKASKIIFLFCEKNDEINVPIDICVRYERGMIAGSFNDVVEGIEVGYYNAEVNIIDNNENLLFSGKGEVVVEQDKTSTLNITLFEHKKTDL